MRWPWRRKPDPLACREFVELITEYLEDALPPAERARFEDHLAACDGCAGYLEDFELTIRTLGADAAPEPPADPHTREVLLQAFRDLRGDP